jgi:hypothetical protein
LIAVACGLALLVAAAPAHAKVLYKARAYIPKYSGSATWTEHDSFNHPLIPESGVDSWSENFEWKLDGLLAINRAGSQSFGGLFGPDANQLYDVSGHVTDSGNITGDNPESWSCDAPALATGNPPTLEVRPGKLVAIAPTESAGVVDPPSTCNGSAPHGPDGLVVRDDLTTAQIPLSQFKTKKKTKIPISVVADTAPAGSFLRQEYCAFDAGCSYHLDLAGKLKVKRSCKGKVKRNSTGQETFTCKTKR